MKKRKNPETGRGTSAGVTSLAQLVMGSGTCPWWRLGALEAEQ